MNINTDSIKKYKGDYSSNLKKVAITNTIIKNGIKNSVYNYKTDINMRHTFSIDLKSGKITNQKSSGRCWLFAALNTLRIPIMDKCNMDTFELSQNYQMFYDKLEKANYFLHSILETLIEKTESRLIQHLLNAPVQDGGQWDMFSNVYKKYGAVPKYVMPETYHSSNTRDMCTLLTRLLRKDACNLRDRYENGKTKEGLSTSIDNMMSDIYSILVECLGEPPQKFDFEYVDKDKKYFIDKDLSPQAFAEKYIASNMDDYVSIINAPTKDKPYGKTYTVKFLGNVLEGSIIKYLNVTSDQLREITLSQLKDDEPVWFGCDVGKFLGKEKGIMDLNQYDYDLMGVDFNMTKAQRLDYGESFMTHAMVFTGVNIVDGRPNRWKVENSWGSKNGDEGYFIMSDEWFDEYQYQIVVNKKYLSEEMIEQLEQKPIELEPWDPMGSLAK